MNIDEIRELILLLDQTSLTELELQKEDYRLLLRKGAAARDTYTAPLLPGPSPLPPAEDNQAEYEGDIVEVTSPMVGTFYAAPTPDDRPYVNKGDHVEAGQTLCIVEAMKLMNELKADVNGTLVEVLAGNAEAVEYGQPLFLIVKD